MRHTDSHYGKIDAVYVKAHHGEPMLRSDHLDLDACLGIQGDVNSGLESPRQVCIATLAGVLSYHVKPAGSRANIIIDTAVGAISSGSLLAINGCTIRITFACEPCTHGAHLAEASMMDFRRIDRYLGLVVRGGRIREGDQAEITPSIFAPAPDSFKSRCAWALDFLPPGRVVSTLEFLTAIGASRSYLRALPRWMKAAQEAGKSAHRVLNSRLEPPSWAPDAGRLLTLEGLSQNSYPAAQFPLTRALWFADIRDGDTEGHGVPCIPAP
jgi:hypothetical protein